METKTHRHHYHHIPYVCLVSDRLFDDGTPYVVKNLERYLDATKLDAVGHANHDDQHEWDTEGDAAEGDATDEDDDDKKSSLSRVAKDTRYTYTYPVDQSLEATQEDTCQPVVIVVIDPERSNQERLHRVYMEQKKYAEQLDLGKRNSQVIMGDLAPYVAHGVRFHVVKQCMYSTVLHIACCMFADDDHHDYRSGRSYCLVRWHTAQVF